MAPAGSQSHIRPSAQPRMRRPISPSSVLVRAATQTFSSIPFKALPDIIIIMKISFLQAAILSGKAILIATCSATDYCTQTIFCVCVQLYTVQLYIYCVCICAAVGSVGYVCVCVMCVCVYTTTQTILCVPRAGYIVHVQLYHRHDGCMAAALAGLAGG